MGGGDIVGVIVDQDRLRWCQVKLGFGQREDWMLWLDLTHMTGKDAVFKVAEERPLLQQDLTVWRGHVRQVHQAVALNLQARQQGGGVGLGL